MEMCQACRALLILEQFDPRVDQQWINMAAITVQSIPVGMACSFSLEL